MKSIGAVLCVAAFILTGNSYLMDEKKKIKTYYGLSEAFMVMKTELDAKLLPLRELTERAGESSEGCVKAFFLAVLKAFEIIGEKDFAVIWEESARESFPWMNAEQNRMLCFPGTVLGKSAGETQAESLESASLYFRSEAEKKKEKMPEIRRLAIGLSFCGGLLAVITLC